MTVRQSLRLVDADAAPSCSTAAIGVLAGHDETCVSVIGVVAAGDHHRSSSPSRLFFRRAVRPNEEIGVNRILQ